MKWIPTTEKMPGEHVDVLIAVTAPTHDGDTYCITRYGHWNGQYWETCDTSDVYDIYTSGEDDEERVVAWMPLPEYMEDSK